MEKPNSIWLYWLPISVLGFSNWTLLKALVMQSCYDSAGEETTSSGHCWSVWNLVLGCHHRTKEQVYQRLMCSQEVQVKVWSDCGCVWTIRPAPAPGSFLSFDHNIITPQAHNDIIATRLLSLANMTQTSYYSVHLRPQKQPIHQCMAQYARLPSVSVTCCAGAVYLETYLKSLCQKQLIV